MNDQITEEAVILAHDKDRNPLAIVRRDPLNNGQLQFFKLELMRYGDMKGFLEQLTGKSELIKP